MSVAAVCIVVFCSFAIRMSFIGSDFFVYHFERFLLATRVCFAVSQAVSYILYPLLGWLSDAYVSRYKVIRLTFIIMIIAFLVAAFFAIAIAYDPGPLYENKVTTTILLVLIIPWILSVMLSLGLFEANAIQFGMDQLLESSSDKLSSFIHWYYWSSYVGHFILFLMTAGIVVINSNYKTITTKKHQFSTSDYMIGRFLATISLLQLMLAVVGLVVLIRYKKRLNIEKPGHNPLKLIYKVLKYAWKHKFPKNRSAFTYWENDIPSRIDLGKSKYGGPFTTEEVEDTKSFFRILLLLFSLLGFHLSGHGYSTLQKLMLKECPNTWLLVFNWRPNESHNSCNLHMYSIVSADKSTLSSEIHSQHIQENGAGTTLLSTEGDY